MFTRKIVKALVRYQERGHGRSSIAHEKEALILARTYPVAARK